MEELQRHRGSRKGYRSHLTRLFANANELMATGTDALPEEQSKTATLLKSLLVQLDRKEKLLADLDTKIFQLVRGEEELETEVLKRRRYKVKSLKR